MSHHLDSPLALQDTRLDLTDQFVFPGESGTVLVMNLNSSTAGKDAKPGFHPEARYEFKVHLDGATVENLSYRITFDEPDQRAEQAVRLHVLTGAEAPDDAATGELVAEGRTHTMISGPNGLRLWAGRAVDPFYIDLTLLAAVDSAIKDGARLDLTGWRSDAAKNSFADATIHSIVLEIADDDPRIGSGRDICTWITSKLATDAGGWRQVNRFGHPMVWPILRQPVDTEWASSANLGHPETDARADGDRIAQLIAGVVAANGTSLDPPGYGEQVARRLLPDLLPYRTGTPANYGFNGFNGRTLACNAPETMFSLILNRATTAGLTAQQNASARTDRFPYVVAAR
ncbi:DUF4331 family protein [Micromonosporaceae bacterium B7E4]